MSVDFTAEQGIAVITINRPERLNAMDREHYQALSEAWIRVRDDDEIRVAVITGAGDRSFTTGADIKSFLVDPADLSRFWQTQADLLLNRGLEVWKPVVAAVNGYCLGGGMTLLLATDFRIASPSATFSLAEVKRGVIPANGGTQRVLRQLPHAIGMEMLLLGEPMDAETALRWGLINRVVEADQLLEQARAYARRLAENAPLAVQAAKELGIRSYDMDLASGLRAEQASLRLLQMTDDAREAAAAFAERRPPQFRGR